MEKLEETVKTYNAKVVIISDIASFFLDTDIAAEEAQKVYRQILAYLADFSRRHQIIVVATYLPHENSKRNAILQQMTYQNASTVLCFTKTSYGKQVALEKHPTIGWALLIALKNHNFNRFYGWSTWVKQLNPTAWPSRTKYVAGAASLKPCARMTGRPSMH